MRLAIVSDTHDHMENLEKAMDMIEEAGVGIMIHCGDLCSPFMIDLLARFDGDVHLVFGNNEGDRVTIMERVEKYPNVTLDGEAGLFDTGSGVVAWTHRPDFGAGLAATGKYQAVFSGHTHRKSCDRIGKTWHINPGELMGLIEDPGFAVFDTETEELQYFSL